MQKFYRNRRLRRSENLRKMISETNLTRADLIYPLFIRSGTNIKNEIPSMPGIFQLSPDKAIEECRILSDLEINAVLLFGIPSNKDIMGTDAYAENGIIQTAVKEIKNALPGLLVITDLCFCEYTSHGHCGIIKNNDVDNDLTLDLIYKTAVVQAKAGSDMIAPSAMMDGQVITIRRALDENGFYELPILSYAAKYASSFYGPFRDAAESAPQFGNRKTYQMDPANRRQAIQEIKNDIEEGADIVMVKPALAYLDIISAVKTGFNVPVAAYNVSGEYAMIKAAGLKGWIDEKKIMLETLTSMKRAGADIIITYFAKEAAEYL